jgi:hypothetical protein
MSAIIASDLSDRKGYGEKLGLAFGLLGSVVGAIIWLFVPAKAGSPWSRYVRLPDLLTATAALLLFISLVLPWYSNDTTFFEEMQWYELLLPLATAVAYAQLHIRAGGRGTDSLRFVVLGAAALVVVMTAITVLTTPDGLDLEWGAYITIVAAVLTAIFSVLAAIADRTVRGAATVAEARKAGIETA